VRAPAFSRRPLAAWLDLPPPATRWRRGTGVALILALGLVLWPVIVRAERPPTLRDALIWLLGWGSITALLAIVDGRAGRRLPHPQLADLGVVLLPAVVALLLTVPTLTDPYFSAIGDEYAFWELARDLARGLPRDPFSQAGVYGNHPVLSSYLMAATIWLFGADQFGWRMASVVALAGAAAAMAALGTGALNRAAGLVAGFTTAVAHPLLAYAHTGYNNLQPVPLTILTLLAGLVSRRTGSLAMAWLGGVLAGLGWYTFYTGRVAVVALVLLLLLQPGAGQRSWQLALGLAGWGLTTLPLWVASREEVLTRMVAESAVAASGGEVEAIVARVVALGGQALRAPWAGDRTSHYISGPLLDPVSGVLALVGLVVGVVLSWRAPWRWLWPWFGLALLAGGATAQYDQLPNSRSFFLLPPLLLFGGLAAGLLWERVTWLGRPRLGAALVALAALAAAAATTLNLYRLHVETPQRLALTPEAVAAMASERSRCREWLAGPLVLADSPEPVFLKLIEAYGWQGRVQVLKPPQPLTPRDLALDRCVIAFGAGGAAVAELQRVAGELGRSDQLIWLEDGTGARRGLFLPWRVSGGSRPPAAVPSLPPVPPPFPAPTPYPAPPALPAARPTAPPGLPAYPAPP
jgi:hypothetical protein